MNSPTIDFSPLRNALALLTEALAFWNSPTDGAALLGALEASVERRSDA